jgi:hypothetical protein
LQQVAKLATDFGRFTAEVRGSLSSLSDRLALVEDKFHQ